MAAYDLHGLQKEVKGDTIRIHEMANPLEPDSHCDLAFANALALAAANIEFAQGYLWVA